MKLVQKALHFKVTAVDEKNYVIRGVFSTAAEDRHGEIVDQNGWKLEEFMANPVILFAHDHYQPAVGKCIELVKDGEGNLAGAIQFAAEEYDFAATLFRLYAGGYMRAFSVGFRNEKYEVDQQNDVLILRENTLYEISCVNVPANAFALAAQKGIDMAPVERAMLAGKDGAHERSGTSNNMQPEKAVEVISAQTHDTIKAAIGTLKAVLDASDKGRARPGAVEHPAKAGGAQKKVSVALINKVVRDLLKAKRGMARG